MLGGTNLYGVVFQGGSKHKSFIINKLCFVISSLRTRWRFVPPKPAISGARYPAKGRINRAAPYKSLQGDVYPQSAGGKLYPDGCNAQIKSVMTINPWDHPRDKVSNPTQLASYSRPCFTISGRDSCMPFHRVVRITEVVSATANKVSEEEPARNQAAFLYMSQNDIAKTAIAIM